MPVIELKNISKTYHGTTKPALKDLSLSINQGEILTLLGPSGCGKTTTLRLIAGFERPDKGTILLNNRTIVSQNTWIPPEKRGIGMVFQDYALFPHLNVEDNIAFNLKDKSKAFEMLELVGLKGYNRHLPSELSGGQQQRVALARALASNPKVILLDEPFSNLDADLRIQMRLEVVQIIKETNTTAIFVTHDQKDALAISDRIAVLNNGTLEQLGTPREIYQYPHTRFVAEFVGQSNILEGIIGEDGRTIHTDIGPIPCHHTHNSKPGTKVFVSIRPSSLEQDPQGRLKAIIEHLTYGGDTIDAVVKIGEQELLAHLHPEEAIPPGTEINFRILPDFIAVIEH